MGDHGRSGGSGGGGRGSHVKEADGAARCGRTDRLVNARGGSSPQAPSTGAPRSPGGGETAGQHRWVEHLSEDTNKVEMVKAMAHGAGTRDRPGTAGRKRERQTRLAGQVCGVSEPPARLEVLGGRGLQWPCTGSDRVIPRGREERHSWAL